MSSAEFLSKRCRQNAWRQHFFGAANSLAAIGGNLFGILKNPMKSTGYGQTYLAATLAPSWRDHAAKPPHPYRVAATGGILAGGMSSLWITWCRWHAIKITMM